MDRFKIWLDIKKEILWAGIYASEENKRDAKYLKS